MPSLSLIIVSLFLLAGCSPQEGDDNTTAAVVAASTSKSTSIPLASQSAQSTTIVIAADPWCPHNCEPGSEREGYMVDIAREVLGEAGYTVKYVNLSWARALQMTRQGQLDAVVGAFKTDAPDFVFPDTPQGRSAITLFTHPDDTWRYTGPLSLHDRKLLVINGYSYTRELDQYIEEHKTDQDRIWMISGPSPLNRAINLLRQGRADAFVEDAYVMDWWASINKTATSPPRKAGLVSESDAFVAFSPARGDAKELAALLSEGTRQRITNGRVQEILDGYGLSLWTETP